MKVSVVKEILSANDQVAAENREWLLILAMRSDLIRLAIGVEAGSLSTMT